MNRTRRPRRHRDQGLTLVEVLASLSIVSILLLATMSAFTTGYLGVHQSGTWNQAISEAQRAMEATRAWMVDQWKQNGLPRVNQSTVNVQISRLNDYGFQPTTGVQTAVAVTYDALANGWTIHVVTLWNDRGQHQWDLISFFGDYDHAKRPQSP